MNTIGKPTHRKPSAVSSGLGKILVGISGGSNSAVTAALLKSQGYQVQGAFLQVVDPKRPETSQFGARCCLTKHKAAAQEVARKLDIPLQVLAVDARFEDRVVDVFVHDLLAARQPNACIPCQLEVRFDALFKAADQAGCAQVATGHHAQVFRDAVSIHRQEAQAGQAGIEAKGGVELEGAASPEDSGVRLLRAANAQKDQSYFLFGLRQAQLSRLMFPLGGFQDVMIERLAREFGLPESSPGNPQEICLIREKSPLSFFEERVAPSLRPPGAIKMLDGGVMGEHRGLHAYQVGQSVKLSPHIKDQEKYQVIGFDLPTHALVIGFDRDLFHAELRASRAQWIRPVDGLHSLSASARFTPEQREAVPCRVTHFENGSLRVELDEPFKGMIVGQAIVFYDGDEVLGGAFIDVIGPAGMRDT